MDTIIAAILGLQLGLVCYVFVALMDNFIPLSPACVSIKLLLWFSVDIKVDATFFINNGGKQLSYKESITQV